MDFYNILTNLLYFFGLRFVSLKIAKFGASAKRKCMFWSLRYVGTYDAFLV